MSRTILSVAYPFAPAGPDTAGGAEQVLTLIERALHESGHCSVVVASEGSQVAGELLPTPAVSGLLTEEARAVVRELHHQNILRALEQYEVDLVHIHAVDFPSYLPPPGVPVLVTLHLPVSWYSPDPFRTLRPDTWFNCVSHSQALDCPESSRLLGVVENGVPVTDLRPNGSKDGFALALGRICPEKNFHSALDAAERAGLPLVLAGEVFPYETHQAYFRDEIQPRLNSLRQFIGPVGFDRKRELLGRARCLLLPSLCRETSSLVAMEALACGTPVVAFDSGAIPEIIEHGVTGFIVRSVAEMAQALMRASEISPARCREAAESRFSARRMVQDYLALYERILSLPRSRSTRLAPEDRATRQVRVARSSLKAKVITRFDDLLRLARKWRALWEADTTSTPFQAPEWLIPWWRSIGEGELRVVTVSGGTRGSPGSLSGVLPFYLWTDPATRERKLLPLGLGSSDYLDGLFLPGSAIDCAGAAFAELVACAPGAAVHLPNLRSGSLLLQAPGPPGYQRIQAVGESCLVLDLAGVRSVESVLPKGILHNLRYYKRRAEREGTLELIPGTRENLDEMLDLLFHLHSARWSEKHTSGVLTSPAVQTMHRESAPLLLNRDLLRMFLLRLNGHPAAVVHGLFDPRPGSRRFYYYIGGMDPRFGHLSPGTLLIGHSLAEAIRSGAQVFDFLRGEETYKRLWGAIPTATTSLQFVPTTVMPPGPMLSPMRTEPANQRSLEFPAASSGFQIFPTDARSKA